MGEQRNFLQEIEHEKTEKARAEHELSRTSSDMHILREQVSKNLLSHRDEIATIREDLESERARSSACSQDNAKLMIEVEALKRQLERKVMEADTITQAEKHAKNQIIEKMDEIGRLRLEVTSAVRDKESVILQVEELSRKVSASEDRVRLLQKEAQESMEATHEMTKHRDSIRDEVAKLKERENVLLAERDALSSNVKSLEVALDEECNKYLRANDAKIQALKIEVTSLHSGNEELKLSLRTEEQRREECALQQRQTESELRDWVSKFEKVQIEQENN